MPEFQYLNVINSDHTVITVSALTLCIKLTLDKVLAPTPKCVRIL